MNYLQLAQRAHAECGLSGTGPQSSTNQTGVNAKLVAWAAQAWDEMQAEREDWRWAWREDAIETVAEQASYSLPGLLPEYGVLIENTLHIGGAPLAKTAYAEFSQVYERGSAPVGKPVFYAVAPDRSIRLAPTPDATYTLTLQHYAKPQPLVSGSDTPALPEQYHMALVYRTVMLYAAHDDHPQLFQDAALNYERWLRRIMATETPQVATSGVALDAY